MPTKKETTTSKKTVKKVATETKVAAATTTAKTTGLSVPAYSLDGAANGSLALPKELFGKEVNRSLLAQATRVYLNNQTAHFSNTKTRGEVRGSTHKMGSQKGSGRARHGTKRAPIFVGGGIALGPKSRKVELDLPKKMKKAALVSALIAKVKENQCLALTGLDKATGKTKQVAKLFEKLNKKSALVIVAGDVLSAHRAVRNIPGISLMQADQVNAFEVIKHQSLILTKEAVEKLEKKLTKEEAK